MSFEFLSKKVFFILVSVLLMACQKSEHVVEVREGLSALPVPPAVSPSPVQFAPVAPHAPPRGGTSFMEKLEGFKKKLDKDPKDVEALIFMANANFDIQRFEKAQVFYLRALEVDPDNPHIRTDLASTYRHMGDSDKAIVELDHVIQAHPNHEIALYNMGIILLNDKEDGAGAAKTWERLVQLNPHDPLSDELRKKISEIKEGKLKKIEPENHPTP
ncbi:MAG: tetratricopeptide repeat protein [Nitrospira sp.]|nr:tetratricopeptide repeat protein [Candidatus Manganitrophaceae bacterium]HIL35577.1 tetratricopeptide repeat protein [Candidatus Manganitrophaceae bacterium]